MPEARSILLSIEIVVAGDEDLIFMGLSREPCHEGDHLLKGTRHGGVSGVN